MYNTLNKCIIKGECYLKKYLVTISKQAQKDIEKIPKYLGLKLMRWQDTVELMGLPYAQTIRGYMDNTKAKDFFKELYGHVSFGEMLSSIRYSEGHSQKNFAKLLDISQQDLCDIEKGRKSVSVERAVRFAKLLKDSPEVFAKYVLQDQLIRAGLNCKIKLSA